MIIKSNDLRSVRPIADNISEIDRIQPYIEEAEKLDVLPQIGASLYKQLDELEQGTEEKKYITNNLGESIEITTKLQDDLLKGCYYTSRYNCGEALYSEGLIKAIVYLAYSRFILQNQINVTAFGAVVKRNDFSDPASEAQIFRASSDAKKIGLVYLDQVVQFMISEKLICREKPSNRFNSIKVIGR